MLRSALNSVSLGSTTFAISLQLFPASLITFSLCSSEGVHGVLVPLFLILGGGKRGSSAVCFAAAISAESSCSLTNLRFPPSPIDCCVGVGSNSHAAEVARSKRARSSSSIGENGSVSYGSAVMREDLGFEELSNDED